MPSWAFIYNSLKEYLLIRLVYLIKNDRRNKYGIISKEDRTSIFKRREGICKVYRENEIIRE